MAPFRPLALKPGNLAANLPNHSVQPSGRVVKQRRNHHTAADWDRKKAFIIQLYTDEGKQAKDVIESLKSEFEFHTGRRQLFNKLKEWGVQKNRTNHERSAPPGLTGIMSAGTLVSGQPESQGLLPQTPQTHTETGPLAELIQFDEMPLEGLDLRTPRIAWDEEGPPWLLSNVLSPQSTEPTGSSTAIAISRRSPLSTVFQSSLQITSETQDVFSASSKGHETTITIAGGQHDLGFPQIHPPMEEILSSLIHFVAGSECVVNDTVLLQLKKDTNSLFNLAQNNLMSTYCTRHNLGSEISLAKNLLSSAATVIINMNGPSRIPNQLLGGSKVLKQRKVIGASIVDVTTKKPTRLQAQDFPENNEMITSIRVLFKQAESTSALLFEVNQYPLVDGSFSSIPRLSVMNIIPSNSLVFQVAKTGSVQDLLKVLASGQANLRDHDENGWSLLHHSLENEPMCRFLVESGLDVDEVCYGRKGYAKTPLHLTYKNSGVIRILLTGGADPTIEIPRSVSFTSLKAEQTGDPILNDGFDILCDIFSLSAHFGVSSVTDFVGKTAFLNTFCLHRQKNDTFLFDPVKRIKFLMDRGSLITEKNFNGSTCLHVFFRSEPCFPQKENWFNALIYAVRQGADVYAAEMDGVTVSQIAYAGRYCDDVYRDIGSYRGDIWDAVLHACGFNIWEFRQACPRTARYTAQYTRKDFEFLWKGREQLCPYWDDQRWPEPFDQYQEIIVTDTSQKILCGCHLGGSVRWLDSLHNDKDCWNSSDYHSSESSECSDSDIDSNCGYIDDDDEGQEEEGEQEGGEEGDVEMEKGEETIPPQRVQTVSYETDSLGDTTMDDFFAQLDAQFGSTISDARIGEA
ncbi:hypothetical protein F5Y03DRAFT_374458 [Xylaria venustula]|nr:hypothetical protein F5Y03DRAFT_374458 [Xylaria venustula]